MSPTPDQWRAIEALYLAAAELPETERAAFVAREARDPELRREVERLLAHEPTSATFLEPPTPEAVSAWLASSAGLVGERLGDFVLEERIASGGMGVVFRARQIGLDRVVAVKVLEPSTRADPRTSERFRREARAVSRLDHPGIAPVLAFGDHGGLAYYAMPLVDGWTLRELMDERVEGAPDAADPAFAARLVREVADALHHAHRQGVIHRDVKPQNLMVTRDGHAARLIDFGIAKVLSLETISRTGDTAGTPLYMSPEQIRAEASSVDHRTDVYSLGAVLYELLAGAPPFQGENVQQLLYRITHERPRPIRASRPAVPRALERVALKALRREPEERYESAQELRADLDRFLAGAPVVAKPLSVRARLRDVAERPRVWVPGGAALVLVASLGSWWGARPTPPRGSLSVALPAGFAAATATLFRVDPLDDSLTTVEDDLELPLRERALEPGWYRVAVHVEGVGASEYDRELRVDESIAIEPIVRPEAEVLEGMLAIPAGEYVIGNRGFSSQPYGESRRSVPAFWIDETEASCARYREFLASHPDVEPPWDEYDEAWDELPVVGLGFEEARRFAEWQSKRLPTLTEWQVAARGPEGFVFPWGNEPGEAAQLAVIGRPGGGSPYEHLVPVASATTDQSPFGALHMLGNAYEWTTSPWIVPLGSDLVPVPSWRAICSAGWDTQLLDGEGARDGGLDWATEVPPNWRRAGVRCVRTDFD